MHKFDDEMHLPQRGKGKGERGKGRGEIVEGKG